MDAEVWRQAKGVLAEALLCPPNERGALVNLRCPDPGLRREVQAYLDQYDEHFLESVISVSDTLDSPALAAAEGEQFPDIHNGDHIGPYVVLDRLGVGGMGLVFLGNDTRLQRKVALKCLSAAAPAAELRSRVLHEARAAARITHPNIAIVHDVIEHENRPFLVMEYVEGENLAAVIKRERLPIEKIVTVVRQLASALAAAHAKGIVHRDLKPANIQVTPDGSVKILDFGVAHAMSAAVSATATATATTAAASTGLTVPAAALTLQADRRVMHPGTPAYMSPEQMFGRAIDQRSDIYSLGVIVYEMATGHRPYSTDDPLEVVLTLSKNFLSPDDARTNLPVQINDVIGKMLAVKPEDRYQTAGELENSLVVLTAPPAAATTGARREPWPLRVARYLAFVLAIPAAATVLGFVSTAWFNFALQRPRAFSSEPVSVWLEIGFRSLVTPAVVVIGLLFALSALRFVLRLLSLSRRVDSLLTASRRGTTILSTRLNFDNPAVLGQAVVAVGLIAFSGVVWHYYPVLTAAATYMSTENNLGRVLVPLRPPHTDAKALRLALELLMVGFVAAIAKVARARARQTVRQGGGALAMMVAMLTLVLLLAEAPYRIVWHNDFERVLVNGERCYAIGESDGEVLAFCPEAPPPRNRIIASSSPALERSGVRESIFTPPETTH